VVVVAVAVAVAVAVMGVATVGVVVVVAVVVVVVVAVVVAVVVVVVVAVTVGVVRFSGRAMNKLRIRFLWGGGEMKKKKAQNGPSIKAPKACHSLESIGTLRGILLMHAQPCLISAKACLALKRISTTSSKLPTR
jgi:hypothetical protein